MSESKNLSDFPSPNSLPELISQLKQTDIPENEYGSYISRFLDTTARRDGVPLYGKSELTPLCNLDCKMCYVHLNKSQLSDSLMPLECWKKIIDECIKCGMLEATFTGGECLTHPDFDELYIYTYNKNVKISIYTNGLLLDEKRIELLKKYPPADIQISLYGSCDEAYEKVTGFAVFNKVYNNMLALKNAGLKFRIAITPNVYMLPDAEKLIRCAKEMGVPYSINAMLFNPRENTGRHDKPLDISLDDYVRLYKYRYTLDKREFTPVDFNSLPDFGSPKQRHKGLLCGGGRCSFSIGYDGKMYICGMLRNKTAFPLDIGFKRAWEIINTEAESILYPPECSECEYRKKCPVCIVHHFKEADGYRLNPFMCERIKRMLSEGLETF